MKARRIESSLSAANLFQERLVKLRSIYEVHRDAYFSVITRETRCPQEFQLKEQALPHGKALTMFSNDRGTLGACSKDVAKMKVSIALLVCGPAFIQVESFVPLEVLNAADAEAVASLQCIR